MKLKILAPLFAVILTILFVIASGCGNSNPANPADPTATFTSTTAGSATNTATISATVTATVTATNTHVSVIYSVAADDGFVDSNNGTNCDGAIMVAGDTSSNLTQQSAVSFSLPAMSGNVTSAILRIYQSGYSGTPLTSIGPVHASHIIPNFIICFNFTYMIYTGNTSLGQICNSYTPGWYELDVTAAVEDDRLNSRPNAQFRIYCTGVSDNDSGWDNISFTTSDDTTNWPELVITYND